MMFKIRQVLTLHQNPKHLGLDQRFIHGYQVLKLTEGHHSLDSILWASILEDSKMSGVLGISSCVVWIHEKIKLDSLRLVRVRLISLLKGLKLSSHLTIELGALGLENSDLLNMIDKRSYFLQSHRNG
jgi:hypothetical protein